MRYSASQLDQVAPIWLGGLLTAGDWAAVLVGIAGLIVALTVMPSHIEGKRRQVIVSVSVGLAVVALAVGLIDNIAAFVGRSGSAAPTPVQADQPRDPSSPAGETLKGLSANTVGRLRYDVQVGAFVALLGEPLGKYQGRSGGRYVKWTWESADGVVDAVVDELQQVKAYAITVRTPQLHARLPEPFRGSNLMLGATSFGQVPAEPYRIDGVDPANTEWSYTERYGRGFELQYQTMVLGADYTSSDLQGVGSAADPQDVIGCLPIEDVSLTPCGAALAEYRARTRVTSYAIGLTDDVEAIEATGLSLL